MTPQQYITLRIAAQRAEHMRMLATLAEVAYRDLMAAHGFDSAQPHRWNDEAWSLEAPHHGDTHRNG